jgi:predicted DNA-binding protein (MmcQ/YjbR family)
MVNIDDFRKLALSFPEAEESTHFEKTSFRIKKKIFATLSENEKIACIKLSGIDQSVFSTTNRITIYPVPNKWGKQGWTFVNLDSVHPDLLKDALKTAFCEVAPKKLSEKLRSEP